jgi:S-adenosylmethionine:tRNA ribosyltransferase-isomerase
MTAVLEQIADRRPGHPFSSVAFDLPPELAATEPPEVRGSGRDDVRLLVGWRSTDHLEHRTFRELGHVLLPGDLLVVNTSATMPASVDGVVRNQVDVPTEVHFSGRLPAGLWTVELRRPTPTGSKPLFDASAGWIVDLPEGGRVQLLAPLTGSSGPDGVRLWVTTVELPTTIVEYLAAHGRPIRYSYVERDWGVAAYQTVFADEPGSAEMPSAARPFTAEMVTRLVATGVEFAPILLHTGVSSPEAHEPPAPEWYRVTANTARRVEQAAAAGGRIIAVGTTAVRALETVTDGTGRVHAGEGWTDTIITPDRGVRVVDGLLTGWHEPGASHLAMLEAIAGADLLVASYREALEAGYRWHEFGDTHLILP